MPSDEPWEVFFEDGRRRRMPTEHLVGLVTELASWQSFLRMLVTGQPANMVIQRSDGAESTLVVVRARATSPQSTYEDPYAGGMVRQVND